MDQSQPGLFRYMDSLNINSTAVVIAVISQLFLYLWKWFRTNNQGHVRHNEIKATLNRLHEHIENEEREFRDLNAKMDTVVEAQQDLTHRVDILEDRLDKITTGTVSVRN